MRLTPEQRRDFENWYHEVKMQAQANGERCNKRSELEVYKAMIKRQKEQGL